MGLLGVGHDWATSLSCIGEGNGNPLQCSCPENPRDGGAWWAAVYGVSQSRTRLKRLSSSRSSKSQEDRERLIVLQWYKTYLGKGLLFLVLIWFGFPKLNTQSAETKSFLHSMVNYLPAVWETRVWSLGWEDTLEKEMATHSSILAWKIPWTEEPGGLQSVGLQRVGHNWATSPPSPFMYYEMPRTVQRPLGTL